MTRRVCFDGANMAMKLFLSYAHEQATIGDTLAARLSAAGHEVFFDKNRLRPGLPFDEQILQKVVAAQVFVFLISPQSLREGGYARSELKARRDKFENPTGNLLPVAVEPLGAVQVDPYLNSVTILAPIGDLAAEVVYEVSKLDDRVRTPVVQGLAPGLLVETIAAYKRLWELTNILPRWPRRTDASYGDLAYFSDELRDWYFRGAGGMFFSSTAHCAYMELQEALTAIILQGVSGDLTPEHYDHIRQFCSQLRTQMAAHIGARI